MNEPTQYEIRLNGGTLLRIPAGRGEGKPYDLLLAALANAVVWDGKEWTDSWLETATTIR